MVNRKNKTLIYRQYSKVSKTLRGKHRRITYYWLIGLVLITFFLGVFFSGNQTNKFDKGMSLDSDINVTDYRHALAANMAKLASLNHKVSAPKEFEKSTHMDSKSSKPYLMRQNAPTRMYTETESPGHSNIKENSKRKILSDSSVYAPFVNKISFIQRVAAKWISHPDFTISQGEFIHAVLETAIDSDLPGMLRAIIIRPVYSYTKDRLLIPKGSRLVGQYSSMVSHGINRIMVIWNRIVLPNGISVRVDSPGTDALGRAGEAADRIDSHFFARFGQAALLSIIGAGAANLGVNNADSNNASQQYRTAIAQSFQQSSQAALQDSQAIKPTLHVHQGALLNVFVAHDLSFYQALQGAES